MRLIVATLLLAVVAVAPPADARTNPYFREQCQTGFITWSVEGGRDKPAERAMRWVRKRFTSYEFRRVPAYWDAMIAIQMQATQPKAHPRWMGATWLWTRQQGQIDAAQVEIFLNRDRQAVYLVTLHEVLHALGIPHYDQSLSVMNSFGLSAVYPVDDRLAAAQNALCRVTPSKENPS